MKRIALVLVAMLVFGGMVLSAQTTVLKVKVQVANVRAQPDMGSATIKQVKLGTLLESKQKVGDWFEISVTNDLGVSLTAYIHVNVVDVVTGGAAPTPEEMKPVTPPPTQPKPAPPVQVQPTVESPVYAPAATNAGGFKIMAAYGMAGLTYSSNEWEDLDKEYKASLAGFAGGLGFETGGTLGFEIDLMYLPKGVRYKGADSGTSFDFKVNFTEISVPLLLKFNLPVQGLNPYLLGGGEIAYCAQAKVKWTMTNGSDTESGDEDMNDPEQTVSQIDYGLVLGGGVGLPLGGMNLVVELRYHLGLANMVKDPAPDEPTVKTNMFLILAGFKF